MFMFKGPIAMENTVFNMAHGHGWLYIVYTTYVSSYKKV